MGGGFAAIAAWMALAVHVPGGVAYVSHGYVHSLITSLGADDEKASEDNLHPIVKQLKESLAKSGIGVDAPAVAKVNQMASKSELIKVLHDAYERDQLQVAASEVGRSCRCSPGTMKRVWVAGLISRRKTGVW